MSRFESGVALNLPAAESTTQPWNPTLTRRGVLKAGFWGSVALSLAACGIKSEPSKSPDATPKLELTAQDKLFQYLRELPPSGLRDKLIDHMSRDFSAQSIDYGGQEVTIYNSSVNAKTWNNSEIRGETSITTTNTDRPYVVTMTNADQLILHIPGIIQDSEKQSIADHLALDGSLIIPFPLGAGNLYELDFSPTITIITPDPKSGFFTPDAPITEKSIYIKEAASLFAFDLLTTQIAQTSRGLNEKFSVMGADGKATTADLFPIGIVDIWDSKGRISAILDIAGYFLSYKLTKGTEIERIVRLDNPNRKEVMDAADYTPIGNTDEEILAAAINFALNTPSVRDLDYVGDLTRLP